MTLDLYLARRFLGSFIRIFFILGLLILVVDTLEQIRAQADQGTGPVFAFKLALIRTPAFLSEIMPVIIVVASLSFCLTLARSSEFVVARAAGISALRAMRMPAAMAFVIGVGVILFLNPLVAILSEQEKSMRAQPNEQENLQKIIINENGFWLRQKNTIGHTVIHSVSSNGAGTRLQTVSAFEFDEDGNAKRRIESGNAWLQNDTWVFSRGRQWTLSKGLENPDQKASEFVQYNIPTTITPDQIIDGYPSADALSIWDLPGYIDIVAKAGFSTVKYQMQFMLAFAKPFLFAAMVLVGAVFTLKNARLGSLGLSALLALISGFALHFFQNLATTLGSAGELPILMAAWAPPIAASLIALGLFLHLEDG